MAPIRGLTLLELMAGMTLLVISFAIALPAVPSWVESWRLTATANALHHDLQAARQHALRHRQFVVMCPSQAGHSCSEQPDWQYGWIIQNERGETLWQRNPHPSVLINSGGRHQALFRPDGSARGSNLTLRLMAAHSPDENIGHTNHAQSGHISVVLSNTGRSRVQHPR